ncbi:MAG: hypothetical protein J6D52_07190 [Clostridia bacterium]|nr:hypothetical protein [Clostridia bacterium]
MFLNLKTTLKKIEKLIAEANGVDQKKLTRAYEETLRLRSQLIGILDDMEDFAPSCQTEISSEPFYQTETADKRVVVIKINEPLPALKELTEAVELHWVKLIHAAIAEESKTGIPKFNKAFVLIEITTPKGTKNTQVWDTSNRAINVIINNLKGIFFEDDNFEHMACGIVADWGGIGETIIRVCELDDLLGCEVFGAKTEKL